MCALLAFPFVVRIRPNRSRMHLGGCGSGRQPLTKSKMQFVHTSILTVIIQFLIRIMSICYWIAKFNVDVLGTLGREAVRRDEMSQLQLMHVIGNIEYSG